MRVNEIFESIQGEGKYAGYPVLFVRLSGCNQQCEWCDTKYHTNGENMNVDDVAEAIVKSGLTIVVWTGGEPLLQVESIKMVMESISPLIKHHIETNATVQTDFTVFDYVCFSPKSNRYNFIYENIKEGNISKEYDIKIVTDLYKVGMENIDHATILMPLTIEGDPEKTNKIEQEVWDYCVVNHVRFCLRQHIHVWGTKRGV